jgi:uncharacterized protein (TIGR02118 family)
MSITITVLYPNTPDSRFDVDYFVNTHIPLVKEHWGGKGLTSVKLLKGAGTADPGTPAPYQVITVLGFESLQAFRAAAKESGAAVIGDIANFTDVRPIVQINDNLN